LGHTKHTKYCPHLNNHFGSDLALFYWATGTIPHHLQTLSSYAPDPYFSGTILP